ncbi:MAG: hypothetical protein GY856_04485 [bacterium]|nr:hypothetical protein [bacterium]
MSPRSKIWIASLIALLAGFAGAQLAPSAEGVVDKVLRWKTDDNAIRLTVKSPDHAYLVLTFKKGVDAKRMVPQKRLAGSAAFGSSARVLVMAPVLYCDPFCRPCSEIADCPLPPEPPPVSESWLVGQ